MARPLRIEYENAWYHVMNRGAERKKIFLKDLQRHFFLELLDQISRKYKIEIYAYCLMSNHYHILLKTPFGNLQKAMRHLNGVYTQFFNRDTKKDGALFRGRYKAILIEEENYLFQVSRYIHLNPVEAKICLKPDDYKWSSYAYYLRKSKSPNWLFCNKILGEIDYESFMNEKIDDEISKFYQSQKISILGSKKFIKKINDNFIKNKLIVREIPEQGRLQKLFVPSVEKVIHAVAELFEVDSNNLKSYARGCINLPRNLAIYVAVEQCQMRLKLIGQHFGISYSGLSSAYNRTAAKIKMDKNLQKIVKKAKKKLELS